MDISRKTDYSLRMLAELVRSDGVVSVRAAAEKNGIPYSFARSIQHDLVAAGIIESTRGARGGGPVYVATCGTAGPEGAACPFRPECHFNPVWCEAERILTRYFDSISLYEVVCEHKHPALTRGSGFEVLGPAPQVPDVPSAR